MLTCCPVVVRPPFCLATGFVAFFSVHRSPAGSGCAGSCGFSSPIWFSTFAMGSPLGVAAGFILDRNEGLVCSSFLFGLFLRVATALRDLVTIRVRCVGRFPLVCVLRLSVVLSPLPFWMGFEPLSEASLPALSLQARFLVVLAEAKSLRVFLALSSFLPYPMLWLLVHLPASCSRTTVVLGALP